MYNPWVEYEASSKMRKDERIQLKELFEVIASGEDLKPGFSKTIPREVKNDFGVYEPESFTYDDGHFRMRAVLMQWGPELFPRVDFSKTTEEYTSNIRVFNTPYMARNDITGTIKTPDALYLLENSDRHGVVIKMVPLETVALLEEARKTNPKATFSTIGIVPDVIETREFRNIGEANDFISELKSDPLSIVGTKKRNL